MRLPLPLVFSLALLGCEKPLQLPQMLQDPGERVGSSWFLCDATFQQEPADAVHHMGIVERLNRQFPVGSPASALERELVRQGFKVEVCKTDPTVRKAVYRWKEHWGGQGLIAFKSDQNGRLIWSTGFNSYGGP
jgi:hypothetical protein